MNQTNYNIIIATDSFKGSMTSYEAGDAIATAIKEQTPSRVTVYPVADGGEGTTEALSFGIEVVLNNKNCNSIQEQPNKILPDSDNIRECLIFIMGKIVTFVYILYLQLRLNLIFRL